MSSGGPLADIRVIALGGIGPVPHASMMLADLGANVVRVDRTAPLLNQANPNDDDAGFRGETRVVADLIDRVPRDEVLGLIDRADVANEGFRPGTAERLGLGP